MSQEIVKFDVNKTIFLENSGYVKEEFQNEFPDNKINVSKTTITNTVNISNTELNEYIRNQKINKYETQIKTDLPSFDINVTVSNSVKIEDGTCLADRQIESCNELLYCSHCHEVYQDYCNKCRALVHILNKKHSHNTSNKIKELPNYILEMRESTGQLGVFSLKVIPENVIFGPFTGLNCTGLSLRIKGGRFVVSGSKLEHLNWMQYINPARNVYEQNLFPFQYENDLYYCSTRRIQEGEELLVYFGEEYEDNLKNVEMDFVPIIKQDMDNVFVCALCCLGFSCNKYLAEHKTVCHAGSNKMSVQELAQSPFCKIYLEAKEYFEDQKEYCCEANATCLVKRECALSPAQVHEVEIERRSSLRSKPKRWKRGIYKCTHCKFGTMYNADFRRHTNEHCEVKMYKCGICRRRYKARESLQMHMVKIHSVNAGKDTQNYSTRGYFKANIKNIKERSPHSHDGKKRCQSSKYKLQTREKYNLKSLINIKHMNRGKYKCADCEFRTYYRTYLERHMKINHLIECSYKCAQCEFTTYYKSYLQVHVNAKHLNEKAYKCGECEYNTSRKPCSKSHIKIIHFKEHDYKCVECEYKTSNKSCLKAHLKTKHRKEHDYKCAECKYKTNRKSDLGRHLKTKHLKVSDYKCVGCEYKTNHKSCLERHIKTVHLKISDYKCADCEFKTNNKPSFRNHIKTIHLKISDYKCAECEFMTNYKSELVKHIKTKHLKEHDYNCAECEYKTNNKSNLIKHIKSKHLKEHDYKCVECAFKTNYRYILEKHVKTIHLKVTDFKCAECEYNTNRKSDLDRHLKRKHLKEHDYRCAECEFKTNHKSNLAKHIKTRHLKEYDYKCAECEYKTNNKSCLKAHVKTKHLKEHDYKCIECEYQTNNKSHLKRHLKTIHLTISDYKCGGCEYKTNHKSNFEIHKDEAS